MLEEKGEIIGYAFLRCFMNGKCFLGKMVDVNHQGKGVSTMLRLPACLCLVDVLLQSIIQSIVGVMLHGECWIDGCMGGMKRLCV